MACVFLGEFAATDKYLLPGNESVVIPRVKTGDEVVPVERRVQSRSKNLRQGLGRSIERRILIYILLTALIEGCLMCGIFGLSAGLDLNDRANMRYVARQYLYYLAYNIGYLMVFPRGMEYDGILSGVVAWAIGCIGMFVAISLIGEITIYRRKRAPAFG